MLQSYFYSESFDLRAPKRKSGVKVKEKDQPIPPTTRPTISSRPPATLPRKAEVKFDDNSRPHDENSPYATTGFNSFSASDTNSCSSDAVINKMYEYVQRKPNKCLRPSSALAAVTKGNVMDLHAYHYMHN